MSTSQLYRTRQMQGFHESAQFFGRGGAAITPTQQKLKSRGLRERIPELRKRTTFLLRLLINNNLKPGGPSQVAVTDCFQAQLDKFGENYDAETALRNYLRPDDKSKRNKSRRLDHVPDPNHAWALGEALRKAGIEWMNGYAFLWSVGAYDAALSTVFEYVVLHHNRLRDSEVEMLWQGAMTGLALPNIRSDRDLYAEPTEKRKPGRPRKRAPLPAKSNIPPSTESFAVKSSAFDPEAYDRDAHTITLEMRDQYSKAWELTGPYIGDLTAAFAAVCDSSKSYAPRHASVGDAWGEHSTADLIAAALLSIARTSSLPLESLEVALLILLGNYLNMLDETLHDGARAVHLLPRSLLPSTQIP